MTFTPNSDDVVFILLMYDVFVLTVFKDEELQESDQSTVNPCITGGVEGEDTHPLSETEAGSEVLEETEPDSGLGDSSVEGGASYWK